ncbi:hypothetical protein ACIBIZ_45540 [Nonomuraea spiralis]|uniref:hypothetical protein n=1 Tax=Nonomuraea spiralis TaxID=46182 RepID=UPI0037B1F381
MIIIIITTAACSSPAPVDSRPLGTVTAPPVECGLLSSQAIGRAIGLDNFYASGSTSANNFSHCVISKSPSIRDKASMTVELHNPFPSTIQSLENGKARDRGVTLPNGVGPGYSAAIVGKDGSIVGAKAFAWTPDGAKVLAIQIVKGAPGRDHRADAIEFARQLRPLLLSSTRG